MCTYAWNHRSRGYRRTRNHRLAWHEKNWPVALAKRTTRVKRKLESTTLIIRLSFPSLPFAIFEIAAVDCDRRYVYLHHELAFQVFATKTTNGNNEPLIRAKFCIPLMKRRYRHPKLSKFFFVSNCNTTP